ncbi:hypothetical Protein YC6258_04971 [Gynuella sunshinyii YC6258]|uniref:Uncharacterized protein n=1 Tax=Gynuella sunshinyii YC6258 TaxID=1445510 RepID=A0A0C5VUM2_9GAMM|nr:hypothetical Protein YC6258_04971 [Gynuella sunshinyii YC6258]
MFIYIFLFFRILRFYFLLLKNGAWLVFVFLALFLLMINEFNEREKP